MKTKLLAILLIIVLIGSFTGIYAIATSKTELNNQQAQINNQISEKEDEISEVNSQLSSSMQEVQNLITQISTYESAISELDTKISTITSQIETAQNDITQKEKEIEEQQELLDKRLVAIYESGNTSYLELLLSSADLSDFVSKYYLISEVAEYDTNLITSIKSAKAELETAKAELENNKTSLETAKSEQVSKKQELENIKAEKEQKVASLTSEEKALEQELEDLESDKNDIQSELARIAREEASRNSSSGTSSSSSGSSAPSAYGYIFPVQGCSKSNIRTLSYPSYSGHTGVDININVTGKSVVAVKSGTVVISEAKRNSDGTYRSYGEYVVINHHDGTMTLYAHMLSGSRTVSEGDTVSQGQVIGTVGSTGNSTGTHLHFEVRINGSPVNPIPYLP